MDPKKLVRLALSSLAVIASVAFFPIAASAGMPGAFPEDIDTYLQLSGSSSQRFQAISFFLVGVIVSTAIVKFLWNLIAKDSGWLPILSWAKAAALVVLWGSLFVLVLTMISGARELMTPGAWKKDGVTYSLEDNQ